ncbi:PIG-L family deacetylase [Planctomycetales bacterium ZRK34]|nr:PIG-L family deacetylase [Planctomycetales bacterium ZRK34]
MSQVALALLAHPDDAEILCGGTLIRLADLGWKIHIATATAGDCGTMTESAEAISNRRTDEARQAAALIGGEYHCLGELDCRVVYDKPTVQKAIDLVRSIAPDLMFTHAPKDYMMDHEIVSMLGRASSFIYGAPNVSDQPAPDHKAIPHLYYCDPIEGVDPLGHPVEPTTVIDITAQMDRKTQMLACHDSQRQWLRDHHGMDEYIDAMQRHGADRGSVIGVKYAEAFVQHRGHAYPRNDLLTELLSRQMMI